MMAFLVGGFMMGAELATSYAGHRYAKVWAQRLGGLAAVTLVVFALGVPMWRRAMCAVGIFCGIAFLFVIGDYLAAGVHPSRTTTLAFFDTVVLAASYAGWHHHKPQPPQAFATAVMAESSANPPA